VSNPNIDRSRNIAAGIALLAEAGYPNGFAISMNTTPFWVSLANSIKTSLADLGITVTVNVPNAADFSAALQSHNHLFFLTAAPVNWEDTPNLLGRLLYSDMTSPVQ